MKPPVFNPDWPSDVKALYDHDVQEIWNPELTINIWNQYHNQLDVYLGLVKRHCPGPARILDVGCAQGTLALVLAEGGHAVCAVDLREAFLEYARSRHTHGDIRFIVGNALELDLDDRFDLIFANQIIEHLVYPERLVSNLKRLLKPRGILVITTPNWHYFINRLPSFEEIGDPSQYEDRQFTADAYGHFFAYRGEELTAVMHANGLDVMEVRFFESPIIAGHLKIRYLHRVLPARALHVLDRLALSVPGAKYLAHQCLVASRLP